MGDICLDRLRLALAEAKDQQVVCSELTVLLEVEESSLLKVIQHQFRLVNVGPRVVDHLLQDAH
jgi:hypothetical protein